VADPPDVEVLVLEDQALVRAGMRALIELSEPAATVREAGSYDEAVACLAGDPVGIAFLDIDLKSARSGIDLLRHIRELGLPTRAVMLSAQSEEAVVMECLRLGASGYILKDMDGEGLFRRALDAVFQGEVFLPANITGLGAAPARPGRTDALEAFEKLGVRGRPLEALYYICQGLPNQLIAHHMGVAESTVANEYNTRLFRQFRVTNRASLIVELSRRGLSPPVPAPVQARSKAAGSPR
jgi:two-component system, NarL family, nitrate/nitrite response regulator NarL